jgi:hypothetical protein
MDLPLVALAATDRGAPADQRLRPRCPALVAAPRRDDDVAGVIIAEGFTEFTWDDGTGHGMTE